MKMYAINFLYQKDKRQVWMEEAECTLEYECLRKLHRPETLQIFLNEYEARKIYEFLKQFYGGEEND